MNKETLILGFVCVFGLLAFGGVCFGVGWYRAGLQAEVYRREGIDISRWEVLWGARPAERTINIKPIPEAQK